MNQNPSIYYEQWTDCYTIFDNKDMAYLFFDLGFQRMLPIADKPNTLQVLVNYKSLNDNGLPDSKEIDIFKSIGLALSEVLHKELNASYIGYLASNDFCGFYFCVNVSSTQKQFIDEVMVVFSEYKYTVHLIENDRWGAYTGCFFPAYQLSEEIQNGIVVTQLENGGDTLDTPRPVFHGFRFRKQSDRANFITTVQVEGFHVEHDIEVEENLENQEYPFRLEISLMDTVDRKTLSDYTSFLWKIAYRNYGLYDGWDTHEISE